jgi:NADPH:quinone reductase-like Zn-dependent oxidoreductase
MKGLFITQFGNPSTSFQWQELKFASLQENEVLIQTSSFGINYADIMARQGLYGEAPKLPFVPGYEVVGTVTEVGSKAKELLNKKVVAFTRFGGYATHVVSNLDAVTVIDQEVNEGDALALATQYVTAYYATNYVQSIRYGEVVLIQAAAGGVGIALNQLCKLNGAITIGLCSSEEKMAFCKAQGFDYVFNYSNEEYITQIKELFPQGLDVCFNSLAGKSFKRDMKLLNHTGRMVIYGGASRSGMKGGTLASLKMVWQMGIIIPIGMMMGSKSIIGINMLRVADFKPKVLSYCMAQVFKMYQEKQINPIVSKTFNADDISSAHQWVEERKSIGKVICKL